LNTSKFESLLKSKRKTGFLGLYTGLNSARDMNDRLCTGTSPRLKYLLIYKFGQDHLELFLGPLEHEEDGIIILPVQDFHLLLRDY
jgi:hypothetical protein